MDSAIIGRWFPINLGTLYMMKLVVCYTIVMHYFYNAMINNKKQ